MKKLIVHFIEKLFATKICTPHRESLEDVSGDIERISTQQRAVGMKLVDIKYDYHVGHREMEGDNGRLWNYTCYWPYAILYFVKD